MSEYVNGMSAGARAGAGGLSGGAGGGSMVGAELNEALIEQHRRAMARLLASDPETRKRLKAVIRQEIKNARAKTMADVHSSLENDPRKAYRAVKYSIYKKVLGGNESILASRKAGARYMLIRPRKLDMNPGQRGGNRTPRSERTMALDTYFGKDRGFVLRFLNSGTVERTAKYGNRGSIAARHIFANSAPGRMGEAAEAISRMFAKEFEAAYNEEMKQ